MTPSEGGERIGVRESMGECDIHVFLLLFGYKGRKGFGLGKGGGKVFWRTANRPQC
jgi:hypothetical protein